MPDYRLAYTTATLHVDDRPRVTIENGLMIELYQVELTDWPRGRRSVTAEGRHVRKDGEPGQHRRGKFWWHTETLPDTVRAIVEDARPGWWETGIVGTWATTQASGDTIEQAARAIAEADDLNFSIPLVSFDDAQEWYQRHCRGLARALAARGLLADGTDRRRVKAALGVLDEPWDYSRPWPPEADRRLIAVRVALTDTGDTGTAPAKDGAE